MLHRANKDRFYFVHGVLTDRKHNRKLTTLEQVCEALNTLNTSYERAKDNVEKLQEEVYHLEDRLSEAQYEIDDLRARGKS